MSWHAARRAIPVPPDAPGTPRAQARWLPLPRLAPTDDSEGPRSGGGPARRHHRGWDNSSLARNSGVQRQRL